MQHLQPNTTLQGGKYRIERVLWEGGFCNTYLEVLTSLHKIIRTSIPPVYTRWRDCFCDMVVISYFCCRN